MSKKSINILLDLDQTLISAEANEEYDFKKNKSKATHFTFHNMDSYYIVFERPGLQKFLDFLFDNFNVSIWTAASKDYALFILDRVILQDNPKRKLDYIFFSYHCDISKKTKGNTKNLSILWEIYNLPGYTHENTFIIDDYDEVYNTQKDNCIIAEPFEFQEDGSQYDKFLGNALITRLKQLKVDVESKSPVEVN